MPTLTTHDLSVRYSEMPRATLMVSGSGARFVACPLPREGNAPVDPEVCAALVAELLRPGWMEAAEAIASPRLRAGGIVRAFRLTRDAPRSTGQDEPVELLLIVYAELEEDAQVGFDLVHTYARQVAA